MSKRTISPHDPRLQQIADMRKRGLKQVEIARASGMSQQTVSRLLHYIDSLTADQLTLIQREREPGTLAAMIAAENKRRAVRNQIYDAYHAGDRKKVWALWEQVHA